MSFVGDLENLPPGMIKMEVEVLSALANVYWILLMSLITEDAEAIDFMKRDFNRHWQQTQEFYMQAARMIFIITAISTIKYLRRYRPITMLLMKHVN